MSPASIAFAAYWATPILVKDIDVLIRCGRIQEANREAGLDTPAEWFARAARAYSGRNDVTLLGRRACELVAADLPLQVPS